MRIFVRREIICDVDRGNSATNFGKGGGGVDNGYYLLHGAESFLRS